MQRKIKPAPLAVYMAMLGISLPLWALRWARLFVGPFGLSVPFFVVLIGGLALIPRFWRYQASLWPRGALLTIAAVWIAHLIALSHGDIRNGTLLLIELLAGSGVGLCFIAFVRFTNSPEQETFMRYLLISTGVVFAFLGLYYLFRFSAPTLGQMLDHFTRSGKNQLGLVLSTMFPISLVWSVRRGWRRFPLTALLAVVITYSVSRSTWIAAAFGCAAVLVLEPKRWRTLLQLALALMASLIFIWTLYPNTDELHSRAGEIMQLAEKKQESTVERPSRVGGSVANRISLLHLTWELFNTHPLFGIGLGAFSDRAHQEGLQPVAHNDYAQIAAEQGVVGLLAFGSLILYALYVSWRNRKRFPLGPIFFGLMGLSCHLVFIDAYTTLWFWSIWGLAVGGGLKSSHESWNLL